MTQRKNKPTSNPPAALAPVRTIRLRAISKRFDSIQALAAVDLDLKAGEVHALLGENGAGKSTLMKILFGLYRPDAGAIYFDDHPVEIHSARIAAQLGLGFVQQHFSLVDTLTVAENVVLGAIPGRLYHPAKLESRIQAFIDAQGLSLKANARILELSVGEKQRVEIIKALYQKAAFIIFDEPTSVLTPQEVEILFATIRRLKSAGNGLVFISHKLDEVLAISDRVTILRGGRNVATLATESATAERLAQMMLGEITPSPARSAASQNPNFSRTLRLQVSHLFVRHEHGRAALNDISFDLRANEILGIAGIDGSGQRELAEAIMGLRPVHAGTITWKMPALSPRDRRRVGLVPPERMSDAFVAEFSVRENLLLECSADPQFRRFGLLAAEKINAHAKSIIESFNVVCKGPQQKLRELSGGNQQKLLLGRALSANPDVLVAMNPTWGVDLAATHAIHLRLLQMCAAGGAVLLFSTDLEEIYRLCDRFVVLHAGRFMGWATAATSITQVGFWMAGRKSE